MHMEQVHDMMADAMQESQNSQDESDSDGKIASFVYNLVPSTKFKNVFTIDVDNSLYKPQGNFISHVILTFCFSLDP